MEKEETLSIVSDGEMEELLADHTERMINDMIAKYVKGKFKGMNEKELLKELSRVVELSDQSKEKGEASGLQKPFWSLVYRLAYSTGLQWGKKSREEDKKQKDKKKEMIKPKKN